ncbi:MAM and LDL-receptor class A domain-containing protein 2 isoform X2 [Alosa sapidissima]|uniref:MAM and LDL-receptor class A domain-containing protein 2 isoform X2 n=1 Tax=Alosa sapidissima TaxID=34773 RepID=UPI001C0A42A9|nr:MAM and LDL-receptor class A domain-containing protein 2 isoform X2 [Alosa sapidissima]
MRAFFILLLVVQAVSSGSNGKAQNMMNEGISGDSSGSDDFGSCDFEQNACGWNDTSKDEFKWRLETANISSIPGFDHTTGQPYGKVMHVEGNTSSLYSVAVLERSFFKSTALACQISFWYHLHDDIGVSSGLYLSAYTNTSVFSLWSIRKGATKGWENATVFIGNRPAVTKLAFSVNPSFIGEQDVMLDDIVFHSCNEGEVPPGYDSLTCDFEKDTCAWYPDHFASVMWRKAKSPQNFYPAPEFDHTTGSGYYMYIGTNRTTNPSMTARLISYPQRTQCVSFWYHMYGPSIGSLKFITKRPGEEEIVVWMRSGTQGNKWRFADLSFPASDLPLQFIFEATLGGTDGSIAIDDVDVSNGVDGSCPAERECTFQGSLCGLQRDSSADFTWVRTTASLSPNTSSPAIDHTLGTAHGYYLSANLWKHGNGSRGRMQTDVKAATPASGECWMFWYHMDGEDVGELNIYLHQPEKPGTASLQPLWGRRGDQGDLWRHGRATVHSPDAPYQIVFEAVVGDGLTGDIAIDDLEILNGPCPLEGFCDFERDLCGWLNRPHNVTRQDWDWTSAISVGPFSPDVDHTTNSALGHYMVLPLADREMTHAYLESEHMEPTSNGCLDFWFHMESWFYDDTIRLTVYMNGSGVLHSLWNKTGDQGNVWHHVMIDYMASSRFQIVFEGKNDYDAGSIALDDIFFRPNITCSELLPTTPAPTTEATTPSVSSMDCNFEEGLCEWEQDTEDSSDWLRQSGLQANSPWLGPAYDHTVGNNKGFYLVVNMSGDQTPRLASISVPVLRQAPDVCVGFWYHMLGPSVSSLDLQVQTRIWTSVAWTRVGTQTAEWLNAQVTIHTVDMQRVLLSAHLNSTGPGFIAVDDITVREGPCQDQDPCGFESQLNCGYEQDVTNSVDWVRVSGTAERVDHTYRTQLGHSMAVLSADLQRPSLSQLLSPERGSTPGTCLRFWHWISADHNDSLSVHLLQEEELGPALWALPGHGSSPGWAVSEVTVSSPFKHRVAFRAELSPDPGAWVLLDDVSVRAGACTPPGSCDFESDLCTWLSQAEGAPHRHDWVHADGHAQGPGSDHTTHSPDGRFLLSKTQNPNSKAELASEWLQPDTDTCFSLWFLTGGSDSGTLRVFTHTVDNKQDLLFEKSQSGQTWSQTSHSLRRPSHFQIIIEAESGGKGFMAIDDILVTPGPCKDNVPILDFGPCQFENGTCDWQDVSDGQFKWQRDRNGTATANTGPSVDHTTGTGLGWYMAVEANDGEHNSYAVLQSPAMEQASADCTLQFYYHMHGEGIGELRVLLQEGSRLTPLLQISGNHGDEWQQAELGVGRTPQVFKLLFEATRTFSELGDIAIDDVSLLNCTLSVAADHCEPGFFTCTNRVCVEPSRVCDFTDDCGDRSDEIQCESKGYAEHCSFEQGLCSWESGAGVPHGSRWTWQRGESAWPAGRGPPRDHTRNTAAGYYIVPGYPLLQGQTSEVLSSTLLPSSSCTVRFFHYAQGGGPQGRLTARLRVEQTGSSDRMLWSDDGTQAFRWRRAVASFSSSGRSKIIFQFVENGERAGGQVALDDITFSPECEHDPDNSQLPTTPVICGAEEFYCWRSEGEKCIPANSQCDYRLDCPLGEDEETCGPCSFESGRCRWQDISQGANKWHLQKASEDTDPPVDHTTGSGHFMRVSSSQAQQGQKALLQSPPLPTASPYCQLCFHFHMGGWRPGTLSVSLQSAQGQRLHLWSRSNNSSAPWSLEHVPLGKQQQDYTIIFSNEATATQSSTLSGSSVALDDISFHNCDTLYQPPDLTDLSCSFDQGLCAWVQGAADDLDWQRRSGPTDTANTGPGGDHTSGQGHYVYLESSHPSKPGDMAQLNSPLVPPVGQYGYCLTVWYHMFGARVGSLKVFVKNIETGAKTLVWEKKQSQSDLWQAMRHHVVAEEVHQIVLEASVGGEGGDIAVDDIVFTPGTCPLSGLCDFEEGDCNWTQLADDDFDWVRGSGPTPTAQTGPSVDHSTNTDAGHYYYLESSNQLPASRARMASSAFPSGQGKCLQFWYHMFGQGMGTLNVYQQPAEGEAVLVFSRAGNMGELWRLAQAPLQATQSTESYRIVVEGVRGQSEQGDMAIDDVLVTDAPCPPGGHCDFELNMCGWTNLYGVDETDWLRGQGLNPSLNTGPSVDHTTNSSIGYYMYVDTSVGMWGETAMLFSDVLLPARGGHCLTFWFHMFGQNVGTLSLWTTNKPGPSEYDNGRLLWTASGSQGAVWLEDSVFVESDKPSWFLFLYQKGEFPSGDVALDDIQLSPGPCYPVSPTEPPSNNDSVFIATGVVITLLVIVTAIVVIYMYMLRRRHPADAAIIENDILDQQFSNSAADFYGSTLHGSDAGDGLSMSNKSYHLSEDSTEVANSCPFILPTSSCNWATGLV